MRSSTYFVMPKWGKGLRPGRTYMDIYRCVFQDGRLVMKYINLLKVFYELAQESVKAG